MITLVASPTDGFASVSRLSLSLWLAKRKEERDIFLCVSPGVSSGISSGDKKHPYRLLSVSQLLLIIII